MQEKPEPPVIWALLNS